MRTFLSTMLVAGLLPVMANAQTETKKLTKRPQQATNSQGYFLGIGGGLDYGGLGIKMEASPIPWFGVFLGLGHNFQTFGVNAGVSLKPLPRAKFAPVLQAMYGYNAVIVVKDMEKLNKTYYGPSFGVGFDWYMGKGNNKLFFGLYAPIRSSEFQKDYDDIKANPDIEMGELSPVTFSIGFNWRLPIDK